MCPSEETRQENSSFLLEFVWCPLYSLPHFQSPSPENPLQNMMCPGAAGADLLPKGLARSWGWPDCAFSWEAPSHKAWAEQAAQRATNSPSTAPGTDWGRGQPGSPIRIDRAEDRPTYTIAQEKIKAHVLSLNIAPSPWPRWWWLVQIRANNARRTLTLYLLSEPAPWMDRAALDLPLKNYAVPSVPGRKTTKFPSDPSLSPCFTILLSSWPRGVSWGPTDSSCVLQKHLVNCSQQS